MELGEKNGDMTAKKTKNPYTTYYTRVSIKSSIFNAMTCIPQF